MTYLKRLGAIGVALFAAAWFVGASANPAFAAHDEYETKTPTFADFNQYCQDRVHTQGAVVVSPGNAYSYYCYSGGQRYGINMRDLCYSVNADDPTHYRDQSVAPDIAKKARSYPGLLWERVDLPHFDHPGGAYTGWTCFWQDTPFDSSHYLRHTDPFTLTKADLDFYCQNYYASSNSRGANSPSRANHWTCLDSGGRPSTSLSIEMSKACNYTAGVVFGWKDRTWNVYDPGSIHCYY